METKSGIIGTVMLHRGYGFVHQDDGAALFFHKATAIKPKFEDLREGMAVEYMVVDCPKGKKAVGLVAF